MAAKLFHMYMQVKHLIEQLQKLNPEAVVVFDIHQHNKVLGKLTHIESNVERYFDMHVTPKCGGCQIIVPLQGKAYISNWPKD